MNRSLAVDRMTDMSPPPVTPTTHEPSASSTTSPGHGVASIQADDNDSFLNADNNAENSKWVARPHSIEQSLSETLKFQLANITASLKTYIEGDALSQKRYHESGGRTRRRKKRADAGSSGSSNGKGDDIPININGGSTSLVRDGLGPIEDLGQSADRAATEVHNTNVAQNQRAQRPLHPTLAAYTDLLLESLKVATSAADAHSIQLDAQMQERVASIREWGRSRQPTASAQPTTDVAEIQKLQQVLAGQALMLVGSESSENDEGTHTQSQESPVNGSQTGVNSSQVTELITPLPSSIAVQTRSNSRQTDSVPRFSSSSASPVRHPNMSDSTVRLGSTPLDSGNMGASSGRLTATSAGGQPLYNHTPNLFRLVGGSSTSALTTNNNSSADPLTTASSSGHKPPTAVAGMVVDAISVATTQLRYRFANNNAQVILLHANQATPTPSRSDSSGAGYLAENEPRSSSEEKQGSIRQASGGVVSSTDTRAGSVPLSVAISQPEATEANSPSGATQLQLALARFFSAQDTQRSTMPGMYPTGSLQSSQKMSSSPALVPVSKEGSTMEDSNSKDGGNSRLRDKSTTEESSGGTMGSNSVNGIPMAGGSTTSSAMLGGAKPPMGRNLSIGSINSGVSRAVATQQGQLPPTSSYPASRRGSQQPLLYQQYQLPKSPVRGVSSFNSEDHAFGLPLHPYTYSSSLGYNGPQSIASSAPTFVNTPPPQAVGAIEALWLHSGRLRADSTNTRRESTGNPGDNMSFVSLLAPMGVTDFGTRRNSEVGLVEVVSVENRLQTPLIRSILANIAQQRLSVPDLLASYPPLGHHLPMPLSSPFTGPPAATDTGLSANPLALPPSSSLGSIGAQSATTMPASSEMSGEGGRTSQPRGNPLGFKPANPTQQTGREGSASVNTVSDYIHFQQAPTVYSNNSTTNNNSHSGATSHATAFSASPLAHQHGTPRSPPLFGHAVGTQQLHKQPPQPIAHQHHFISAASPLLTSEEYIDKTPPPTALAFTSPTQRGAGESPATTNDGAGGTLMDGTASSSHTRSSIVVGTGLGQLNSDDVSYASFVRQPSAAITTGTSASASSASRVQQQQLQANSFPPLSLAARLKALLIQQRAGTAKRDSTSTRADSQGRDWEDGTSSEPVIRTATAVAERNAIPVAQPSLMSTDSASACSAEKTPHSLPNVSPVAAPKVWAHTTNSNSSVGDPNTLLWVPVPLAPQYLDTGVGEWVGPPPTVGRPKEQYANDKHSQEATQSPTNQRHTIQEVAKRAETSTGSRLMVLGDDCFGNSPTENPTTDPSSTKTSLNDNAIGKAMSAKAGRALQPGHDATTTPTTSAADTYAEYSDAAPASFSTKDVKDGTKAFTSKTADDSLLARPEPFARPSASGQRPSASVVAVPSAAVDDPAAILGGGPLAHSNGTSDRGAPTTLATVSALGASGSGPNSLCFTEATSASRAQAGQAPGSTPSTVVSGGTIPTSVPTPQISSPTVNTSPQSSMETRPLLSGVGGYTVIRRLQDASINQGSSGSVIAASTSQPMVHTIIGASLSTPTQPCPPSESSHNPTNALRMDGIIVSNTSPTTSVELPRKHDLDNPLEKSAIADKSVKHMSMSNASNMATDGNNTSFAAMGNSVLSVNQQPRRTGTPKTPRPISESQTDMPAPLVPQLPPHTAPPGNDGQHEEPAKATMPIEVEVATMKPATLPPSLKITIKSRSETQLQHTPASGTTVSLPTPLVLASTMNVIPLTSNNSSDNSAPKGAAKPTFHHQTYHSHQAMTAGNSMHASDSIALANAPTTLASVVQYIHDTGKPKNARTPYDARSSGSTTMATALSAITSMSEGMNQEASIPHIHGVGGPTQLRVGSRTPNTGTNSTVTSQDHYSTNLEGNGQPDPRSFVTYVLRAYELAKLDPLNASYPKQRRNSPATLTVTAAQPHPYCTKAQLSAPSQLASESKGRVNEYLDSTELNIARFVSLDKQAESQSLPLQLPFFPHLSPMTPIERSKNESDSSGAQNVGDSNVLKISGQTLSAEETQGDLSFPKFDPVINTSSKPFTPPSKKDTSSSTKGLSHQGNPLLPPITSSAGNPIPEEQTIIVPESMPASPTSRRSKGSSGQAEKVAHAPGASALHSPLGRTNTDDEAGKSIFEGYDAANSISTNPGQHATAGHVTAQNHSGVTPTASTSFVFAPMVNLGSDSQSELTATRNPTSPIQGISIKKVTSSNTTPIPLNLLLHQPRTSASDFNPSCSSMPYATNTATGHATPSTTIASVVAERSMLTTEGDSNNNSHKLQASVTAPRLTQSMEVPPITTSHVVPPSESPLLHTSQTPNGSPPLAPTNDGGTPNSYSLPTMLVPQKASRPSPFGESSSSNPKSLSRSAGKEAPTMSRSGLAIGREELQNSASNTNQDSHPKLSTTDAPIILTQLAQYSDRTKDAAGASAISVDSPPTSFPHAQHAGGSHSTPLRGKDVKLNSKAPSFASSQPTTSSVFESHQLQQVSRSGGLEVSVVISEATMELAEASSSPSGAAARRASPSAPHAFVAFDSSVPPVLNLAVYGIPHAASSGSLQKDISVSGQHSSSLTTPHASSTVTIGSIAHLIPSTSPIAEDANTSNSNALSAEDNLPKQPRTSTRRKLESRRLSLNAAAAAAQATQPTGHSPTGGRRRSSTFGGSMHTTSVPPSAHLPPTHNSACGQGGPSTSQPESPTTPATVQSKINQRARAATLTPQSSAPQRLTIPQVYSDTNVGVTTEESSSDQHDPEDDIAGPIPMDLVKDERGRRPTLPSVPDMVQQLQESAPARLSPPPMAVPMPAAVMVAGHQPPSSRNLSMLSSVAYPSAFGNSFRSQEASSPFPTLSALTISMGGREAIRSGRSGLTFGKAFAAASSAVLSSTTVTNSSSASPTHGIPTLDPFQSPHAPYRVGGHYELDGLPTASSPATSQSIASNAPFGMGAAGDSKSRSMSSVSLESRGRGGGMRASPSASQSQMADGSASASNYGHRMPSSNTIHSVPSDARYANQVRHVPLMLHQSGSGFVSRISPPSSQAFTSGLPSSGSAVGADTSNTITTDNSVAALSNLSSRPTTGMRLGGSTTTSNIATVSPPPFFPPNTSFAGLSFPSASYSHSAEHTPGTGLLFSRAEASVISPIQFPHPATGVASEEKSTTTTHSTTGTSANTAASTSTNHHILASQQPSGVTFVDSSQEPNSGKAERVSSNGTNTSLVAFQGFQQQRPKGRNSVYSTYTVGTGDLPHSRRSSAVMAAASEPPFLGISSQSHTAQGSGMIGLSGNLASSHSNVNLPIVVTAVTTASNTRNNSAVGAGQLGLDGQIPGVQAPAPGMAAATPSNIVTAIHSISSGATSQTIRSESSGLGKAYKIVELMESSSTPSASERQFHGRLSSQTYAVSPATNMILPHEGSVSIPSNISVGSAAYMSQNTIAGPGLAPQSSGYGSSAQLYSSFPSAVPLGAGLNRAQLVSMASVASSAKSAGSPVAPASPLSATNVNAVLVPSIHQKGMGPRGSEFDPPLPNFKGIAKSAESTPGGSKPDSPRHHADHSSSPTTVSTAVATVNSSSGRSHSSGPMFATFPTSGVHDLTTNAAAGDNTHAASNNSNQSNPLSTSNLGPPSVTPPLQPFASMISESGTEQDTGTQSSHIPSVSVSAMTSHAALPTLLPSNSSRTHTTATTTTSDRSGSLMMASNLDRNISSNNYTVSDASSLARVATDTKLTSRLGGGTASPTRRHGSPIHHVSSPKRNVALTEDDIPFPVRGTKSATNLRQAAADSATSQQATKTSNRISRRVVSLHEPSLSQDPSFHGNFSSTLPAYENAAIVPPLVPKSSVASFGIPTSSSGVGDDASTVHGRDDSVSRDPPIEVGSITETTSLRTEGTDATGGANAGRRSAATPSNTHLADEDLMDDRSRSAESAGIGVLEDPTKTIIYSFEGVPLSMSHNHSYTRSRSATAIHAEQDAPSSGAVTPTTDLSVFPPLLVVPSPLLAHANAPPSSGDLHLTGNLTVSVSGISAPSHSHSMPHFGWSTNSGKAAHPNPMAAAAGSLLISKPSLSTESASFYMNQFPVAPPSATASGVPQVVQTALVPALANSGSSGHPQSSVSSAFPATGRGSDLTPTTDQGGSDHTPIAVDVRAPTAESSDQPISSNDRLVGGESSASMTNISTVATTSMRTVPTGLSLHTTAGTSASAPNRVASSRSMDSRVIGSMESFTNASNSNATPPPLHFMNTAIDNPFGFIPITTRVAVAGTFAAHYGPTNNPLLPLPSAVGVQSVSMYHISKSTLADEGFAGFAVDRDGTQLRTPSATISMPSIFDSSAAQPSHHYGSPPVAHAALPVVGVDREGAIGGPTTVPSTSSAECSATGLQTATTLSDSAGGHKGNSGNSLSATRPPLPLTNQSLTNLHAQLPHMALTASMRPPSEGSDCFDHQLPQSRVHHLSTSEQSLGTSVGYAPTEAPRNQPSMSDSRLRSVIGIGTSSAVNPQNGSDQSAGSLPHPTPPDAGDVNDN